MSQTKSAPVPKDLIEPSDEEGKARWLAEDIADSESGEPTFSNEEVFAELCADIDARRARRAS